MSKTDSLWSIWVDTGGTFTDCVGIDPAGNRHRAKVLSSRGLRGTITEVISDHSFKVRQDWEAPDHFINGFQFRLLNEESISANVKHFKASRSIVTLDTSLVKDSWIDRSFEVVSPEEAPVLAARLITQSPIDKSLPPVNLRLATTRGTNALLERKGASVALFITRGFGDLITIGTQQRPDLFALNIEKPSLLYDEVIEVNERMDADGKVLAPINPSSLKVQAEKVLEQGITSAAVVFMNSYMNADHEQNMKRWLCEMGFEYISVSSDFSRFVKILPRAQTTLVNAYLAPVMESYLDAVKSSMHHGKLSIMTSAGGLMNSSKFTPKDGLLSGPAAGVVGAAAVGKEAGFDNIISFDMGGTSSDVSRVDEDFEYVFEHVVGDARLTAPAVAIETVAAGGGSICSFDGHALQVGPESAGAAPGPACYGAGGPLTLTDINVLAGRLDERNFHIPIDIEAAQKKLGNIVDAINTKEEQPVSRESVLEGFLDIANQRMAEAIEKISLRKGYDPKEYALVSFGGAGGQHCCGIARRLGIDDIIIPEDAGLLSASGLGHAVMEHFEEEQILKPLDEMTSTISERMEKITQKALDFLSEETHTQALTVRRRFIFMRLKGQESTLEITYRPGQNLLEAFREKYKQRYGHWVDDAVVEVESLRVVVSTKSEIDRQQKAEEKATADWPAIGKKDVLFDGEMISMPVFDRQQATAGAAIAGMALILDPYSTLLVEPGWQLNVDQNKSLILHCTEELQEQSESSRPEAVTLELFTHRFTSITEKMGEMLQRTALSVNVKERQDFSCAILNPGGELVVNAPHIPVHLGALGICVRSLRKHIEMEPGDVIITNHPAYGGSHLPDVTIVTPVFTADEQLIGYTANRAHHAEIGGMRPGSMPPNATNLAQEGVVISPMHLLKKGKSQFDQIRDQLLSAAYPTRNVDENIADLQAQVAANRQGAEALQELAAMHGLSEVQHYMNALKERAAHLMRQTIKQIPNGSYKSKELLDDGTPLCALWQVDDERITIDFEGTGAVHPHNLNATPAIVNSVVMYVLRVLVDLPIPLNEGLMEPVTLNLPKCLLNPDFDDDPQQCPAVVGGNVEISQRLTDTLLKPFERIACGQGTMNNILFGNDKFGYYETVGGGTGAGPDFNGTDGVHHHMTNTKGTDPELFEQRYPVRLDKYAIRKGSGGEGKHKGGDGIIREMTFLEPVQLSVLTQHRKQAPYGQQGGQPGKTGKQWVIRSNGEKEELEPADGRDLEAGDQFILHTPGGGGFGSKK